MYSVDRIAATFSNDLSGAWADDIGNTYYLRHDLTDNTVWYAGLSPLGSEAFGQVFHGIFYPAPKVFGDSAVPEGIGGSPPVLPQDIDGQRRRYLTRLRNLRSVRDERNTAWRHWCGDLRSR